MDCIPFPFVMPSYVTVKKVFVLGVIELELIFLMSGKALERGIL